MRKVHKCIYVCTHTHTCLMVVWSCLGVFGPSGWRAGVAAILLVFIRGAAGSPSLLYYAFHRGLCFLHKESACFLLYSRFARVSSREGID